MPPGEAAIPEPLAELLSRSVSADPDERARATAQLAQRSDELPPALVAAVRGIPPAAIQADSPHPHVDAWLVELEEVTVMTPRWVGSPYAWVRELSPSQKGRLGEEMVRRLCRAAGCEVRAGSNPGHDLVVTEGDWSVRVEVKFSTLNDIAAGEPYFQWLQLRPADDFEVVALVALAPRRMRCFLLGRNEVLSRAVGHHGGGGATETRKLVVPAAEIDQAWLGPDICTETESLPSRLREVSRRRGGGRAG